MRKIIIAGACIVAVVIGSWVGAKVFIQGMSNSSVQDSGNDEVSILDEKEIKNLKSKAEWANDRCQVPSNSPETVSACEERDNDYHALFSSGWCWGPADQAPVLKQWQRCSGNYDNFYHRSITSVGDFRREIIGRSFCHRETAFGITHVFKLNFSEATVSLSEREITNINFKPISAGSWSINEGRYSDTGARYIKVTGDNINFKLLLEPGPGMEINNAHLFLGGSNDYGGICTASDLAPPN